MLSQILTTLEFLQAELDRIDPGHQTVAPEAIAVIATSLREGLAQETRERTGRNEERPEEGCRAA